MVYFNDAAGGYQTGDDIFKQLSNIIHVQNPHNGRLEYDASATILLADSAETTELRNECWRRGFHVRSIDMDDDEVLGMVQRVATLFDRRRMRVSSECRHLQGPGRT